jgi:cytochrome c biogenesis protein
VAVQLRPSQTPPTPGGRLAGLRQGWREFRSMRTALALLLLLAAASILGSLFPQESISPQRVALYFDDHPALAPVLDRLGIFDVFGSPWYMAIYVALLAALVACLVPRARALARMVGSRPPRGGRLDRYRNRAVFEVAATPEAAAEAARRLLRRRRFRVVAHGPAELAAEKGYLREAGSLLFHLSFLLLLVGLAYGKGFGYRGQATIVEGATWANARVGYDAFTPGRFFGPDRLAPFQLRLDDFSNDFWPDGTPREFASQVAALDLDGRVLQRQRIAPNRPMTVDGVRVFQSDYGYAPVVRVRARDGRLLAGDPVLTRRDPASEVSSGAVKLAMLRPQVGLELTMFTGLRTAPDCPGGLPFCNDPRLVRPVLVVLAFTGDLQADRAQSVFTLDHSRLRPVGGRPLVLGLGQSGRLPDGSTVTFAGLRQYTVLTLARDPGVPVVAVAAGLILLGLLPSLYVTRRRVWVRATPADGDTRVELAGLALQGKAAFEQQFAALAAEVGRSLDRSPAAGRPTTLDRVPK